MKIIKTMFAVLVTAVASFCPSAVCAQGTVVAVGTPITSVEQLSAGGRFILHNIGRDNYLYENPYSELLMGSFPTFGTDASADYVVTLEKDGNSLFTIRTRRGRYIPEVDTSTPLTVGSEARAGHFRIQRTKNGHFTIINSVNTGYGFDGTANSFVGWNAGQGSNCLYDILPVTLGPGNYPLDEYEEPAAGDVEGAEAWNALEQDRVYLSWASKDINYSRRAVPALRMTSDTTLYVWRGERAAVKAVVFAPGGTKPLKVKLSGWNNPAGKEIVGASAGTARWMRYVLTDSHNRCGVHPMDLETWTVADVIDRDAPAALQERSVRPVWCTLEIPRDLAAGAYDLTLEVADAATDAVVGTLGLKVQVRDHALPLPADQRFHLDLWQQPYSVSRYHGVERWSDAHFEALRPYMRQLARAGQKVVTAILFHEPWRDQNDQSHDKFDPMIETTLRTDGTWAFDFTLFDNYVNFMAECGISARINCYSMIPWNMSFRYIDEATDTYRYLRTTTSSEEYRGLWTAFLTAFAAHLRERGWFEKTCISMDERGLDAMLDASKLVREVVPDMKMALAGNYHVELVDLLDDYCLAYAQRFSADELARRRAAGQISTSYTCCTEAKPNLFTNSLPAEAAYLPLQAVATGLDGYLHWSWINWPEQPLLDSRFRLFASGDTYISYPGDRSSVRFERLVEGIQQSEKIHILREAYRAAGDTERLEALEAAIEPFLSGQISASRSAASMVNTLEAVLNDAPLPAGDGYAGYCALSLAPDNRAVALEKRWLKQVETTGCQTDLSYSTDSPSATGVVIAPAGIEVTPGSTFKLRLKAAENDDDLAYCRLVVAADWDRNGAFGSRADEIIGRVGTASAATPLLRDCTVSLRVPADATPGSSVLRVCYADAWSAEPELCGELYKGFAFDIPMTIVSTTAVSAPSAGGAAEWNGTVLTASVPVNVSVYGLNGSLLHSTQHVTGYDMQSFTPGWYHVSVTYPDGHREGFSRMHGLRR